MNEKKPRDFNEPALSAQGLTVASPLGDAAFSQPVLGWASLTVVRRPAATGGGVALFVRDEAGRETTFVLDEAGRDRLVERLTGPVVPPCFATSGEAR